MGRKGRCSLEPMGGTIFLIDWIDDAQVICRISFLAGAPNDVAARRTAALASCTHGNSHGGQDNPGTAKLGLLLGAHVTTRSGTASTFSCYQ